MRRLMALLPLATLIGLLSCDAAEDCSNGDCICEAGASCEFTCDAPPCHVTCESESDCAGTCANGSCRCGDAATCDFACGSPPCHVDCDGDNPSCQGECANGTCKCGSGSTCTFTCLSGPCHAECEGSCVVECPGGGAGTQSCDIVTCAAGEPEICSEMATVCGAPCP